MEGGSFNAVLAGLDPVSRALLDLSLRRGMRPDEIAGMLGTDEASVTAERDRALQAVADELGMAGAGESLDHVRAMLAELPDEDWDEAREAAAAALTEMPGEELDAMATAGPDPALLAEAEAELAAEAELYEDELSAEDPADDQVPAEEVDREREELAATLGGMAPAEDAEHEPHAEDHESDVDHEGEDHEDEEEGRRGFGWAVAADADRDEDDEIDYDEQRDDEDRARDPDDLSAAGDRGRRSRLLPLLLGLLALALAGGLIALLAAGGDDDSAAEPAAVTAPAATEQTPTAPASTSTTPSPPAERPPERRPTALAKVGTGAGEARGRARLTSGGERLDLSVRGLRDPGAGAYEVWLYDSVIEARSLGRFRGTRIALDAKLPEQVSRYSFVDVSLEPADGNPNHSGRSVMRVPTARLRDK